MIGATKVEFEPTKLPGADVRPVLVGAVVIAGDRPGADVGARAHLSVSDVGEVVRLGACAEARILDLNVVAHTGALAERCPRAQTRKGADGTPSRDVGGFEHRVGVDLRIVIDHRVGDDHPLGEPAACAGACGAGEPNPRLKHRVAPDRDPGVDPGVVWVLEGDPLTHERLIDEPLRPLSKRREIDTVVGAGEPSRVGCDQPRAAP